MPQSPLRLAFGAARPLRNRYDPTTYLRMCRACRARLSTGSPIERPNLVRPYNHLLPTPSHSKTALSRRHISATPSRPATVVLQNPRTDDDGNSMTITISDRAARRLRQITSSPTSKNTLTSYKTTPTAQPSDSHLRVTVTSGGCHGFQYLMALEDSSKIDGEEDTIFEYTPPSEPEAETEKAAKGKAEVVMDSASLELLKGSTIDFSQELIGSQFKIVGNPKATSSCGCGTSFDIE